MSPILFKHLPFGEMDEDIFGNIINGDEETESIFVSQLLDGIVRRDTERVWVKQRFPSL